METLNDLITTKQQEAQKQADRIWNAGITLTHNDLDEILNALVSDTAHSVLDAVKELVPEVHREFGTAANRFMPYNVGVAAWNACRAELLSRLERFSSNEE